MTNKILKIILLVLVVIFLIVLFIFISTFKDKRAEMTETTALTTQTQEPSSSQTAESFFLTVSSPVNGTTQSSTALTVKGKTTAGTEIFVNDKEGKADASGNFSVSITLDEGDNTVLVVASDASGNSLEKELTVTVSSFQ